MELAQILAPISEEMQAVDRLIRDRLTTDVALINQLSHYIVNSGGKRLRPAVTVLAACASGYEGDEHLLLAAIVEFIHTATLLHDDVVDASALRRGRQTANAIWGNEASVLTGDYLYTRAFQMMVSLQRTRVFSVMADTTNAIAEGEVLQLLNCHDPDVTEARYRDVIERKTARLFEAGTRLGAVLAQLDGDSEAAMARYGLHLGTAFQLVDDALDYSASADNLGKNIGDDLSEGKATLPLIHAMHHSSGDRIAVLRKAIEHGGLEHIDAVQQAIESTGAIGYTVALARTESDKAIAALTDIPESIYKRALIQLAQFTVARTY